MCKLFVVVSASIAYGLQAFGYWHKWDTTCRNDIALHYWKCMEQTHHCNKLFDNKNMFYCTEADLELENKKFCHSGYCDVSTKNCRDDKFQLRITDFATEWKNCMFNPERDNPCTTSLSANDNGYDNCVLGVEIFLFVFLISDIGIDMFLGALEPIISKRSPLAFVIFKIIFVLGAVLGWYLFLISKGSFNGPDLLDFAYVVLFIGVIGLLEVIKLFR